MFVGRVLYILGLVFVSFSIVVLIMSFFSNGGGDVILPIFGLLNGFLAMGVGDLVIDANYRKSLESKHSQKE
ncbi:hypothetical protein SAMN05192533_101486 [Mesobacillus persicus]|uniref:Uncharacterized protein n=1 Tax=Mesobacillus persicus TaxID=930146 RepID=A0A1H7WMU5_9BACI|nr:hypothetical protein [Mesobacillus persicus]SEM22318.1 hypothetical protein SAMN05192533_101486 [Mesobacillus persicus]